MNRKIIVTEDNSKTLLISDLNETYHSTNGAYNEAIHVFIEAGLAFTPPKETIRIFEMGFGTGLNALVSIDYAIRQKQHLHYITAEKYPLPLETVKALDYVSLTHLNGIAFHHQMHETLWEKSFSIHPLFDLHKLKGDIHSIALPTDKSIDLIFYDAFGPRTQPELWELPVLQKMFDLLTPGGILVTYCAQGQFKRNLKQIGFKVENLPGPPGKREMTRAIKTK